MAIHFERVNGQAGTCNEKDWTPFHKNSILRFEKLEYQRFTFGILLGYQGAELLKKI